MYSRGELFMRSREGYFGVYFLSCAATREINTKITLFLTRHNESINDTKTRIFTHHPRVSLARFTFCWWRHNGLAMTSQWPDNCDTNTWQVISNSLDIDFIHGDIHGRSCKNWLLCFNWSDHIIQDGRWYCKNFRGASSTVNWRDSVRLIDLQHDDVIKWKHFPRYWPFVRGYHRSPVNSPHKGHWCGTLIFSLICAWIKGWVNNRGAGDLRHHLAHYDVTVMRGEMSGNPTVLRVTTHRGRVTRTCVSKLGHVWLR